MSAFRHTTTRPFSTIAFEVPRRLPQPRENPCWRSTTPEAVPFGRYQSTLYEPLPTACVVFTHVALDDENPLHATGAACAGAATASAAPASAMTTRTTLVSFMPLSSPVGPAAT